MIEHSPELDKLGTALAKAQAVIATATKDSKNPFFNSTYADLASVWEACRGPLTENGLSVAQFPGFIPGEPPTATVTTVLLHTSGQWMSETAGAPLPDQKRKDGSMEKANAQGVGSAITYLRRYALAAVASVSPADDDGNAASEPKTGRGGTSTAPSKGSVAAPPAESAPPPQRAKMSPPGVPEPPEGPTRDTPYPGAGAVHGKTVREWAINQLRAVDAGTVPVTDEWIALARQELKARAAKAQIAAASGAP